MTDIELMTAAEIELDEAAFNLEAIATTCAAHAALIDEALKAIRMADALMARVRLV